MHLFDRSIPTDHEKEHLLSDWVKVEVLVLICDFRPNIWCYCPSLALSRPCRWECWWWLWCLDSRLGLRAPVVNTGGLIKSLITQDEHEILSAAFFLPNCRERSTKGSRSFPTLKSILTSECCLNSIESSQEELISLGHRKVSDDNIKDVWSQSWCSGLTSVLLQAAYWAWLGYVEMNWI